MEVQPTEHGTLQIQNQIRIPMTAQEFRQLEAQLQHSGEASLAGVSLAVRRWRDRPVPRRERIWTGVLAGKRAYRGQPVVLRDGNIGFVYGIQRGMAALWRPAPFVVGEREYFVLPVEQIKPYRLPSAVRLGRCKLGCKERFSERKRAVCQDNGMKPCRPGRRRGRPTSSASL